MDQVPAEVRSKMMRAIRAKNTKPELYVRRSLHSAGYRFRLHRKDLPGTPDRRLIVSAILKNLKKIRSPLRGLPEQAAGGPVSRRPGAGRTRMFLRGGFELHSRPETGVKRNDFDFRAVRPSDRINVEVTALTAPAFSENTVRNALNKKHKQIPDDLPAIIFCAYPESWFSIGPDLVRAGLIKAANAFFSSKKRVNAIAFMGEQHWNAAGDGTQGALFVTHLPIANPGARLPISSMDFLLNVSRDSPRSIVERNNLLKELPLLQTSEFYRWVDNIFDGAQDYRRSSTG